MTTILEKFRLTPVKPFVPRDLSPYGFTIDSTELIGIEVEVENVQHHVDIPGGSPWAMTTDNSLRNTGMEFVSRPIAASCAPASLNQLLGTLLNQECHFSPRTSVHVHLNAQDMELNQVTDLVLIYSVFERLFYKFAGRGRIRNIFCVPITETNLLHNFVQIGVGGEWSKYTGLNLAPLRHASRDGVSAYGTIEFRQMHGTFSVDKLCLWISLIVALKAFVLKSDTKDIRKLILGMDDNFDFDALLHQVFGELASVLKFNGLEDVRDCYMATKAAMCSTTVSNKVQASLTNDSPFVKFKG